MDESRRLMGFGKNESETKWDSYIDNVPRHYQFGNGHDVWGVLSRVDVKNNALFFSPCVVYDPDGFASITNEEARRPLIGEPTYDPLPPEKSLQCLANDHNNILSEKISLMKPPERLIIYPNEFRWPPRGR